jgi:ABC-type glycerol-3-phosphate transport system substrate-binding protein
MQQTKRSVQRLVALTLVIAITVGVYSWWQDAPLRDKPVATTVSVEQAEQVILTLVVEESNLSRYSPLIKLFEQEQPGTTVRLIGSGEVSSEDEGSQVRSLAAIADIFLYYPSVQDETEYLLDLRPFVETDTNFDAGDFLPGLLADAPEPLWSLPTAVAYQVIYFDKLAFTGAGLPYPVPGWTASEFLAAALALTQWEGNEVTRWGYIPAQMRQPPLLSAQLNGPLAVGGELRLTDSDVVAAVQWLSDLFTVHRVSPWLEEYKPPVPRTGTDQQAASALVNAGRAAMWHHRTHLLFNESDENVGVTTVPRGPSGYAADPTIYAFAISRGTRYPEVAWQLLHFLSRQPPQDALIFKVNPVPARRSVSATIQYWERIPDELLDTLQYAVENNVTPRITYQAANFLQQVLAAHIDDHIPVATALEQVLLTAGIAPEEEGIEAITATRTLPKNSEDDVQITFATEFSLLETQRRLANQFQQESGIVVRVIHKEGGISPADQDAGSDCFLGQLNEWQDQQVRVTLLSLRPLVDLDDTLRLEEFYTLMLDPLIIDGELWGIPAGMSIPHMEYNRHIFQVANISTPPFGWTFDDFLYVTQQVTQGDDEKERYGYADPFAIFYGYGVRAFDVQVVDHSTSVPHFDFDAAAEMVTWYANLIHLHKIQPLLTSANWREFLSLVRTGRVAIWPGGFSSVGPDQTQLNFEVGVLSIPTGPSGNKPQPDIFSYHILADSLNQAACWKWITFLSNEPMALRTTSSTLKLFPAKIETAESAEHIAELGLEMTRLALALVNSTKKVPVAAPPGWMRPGFAWLAEAYQKVSSGEAVVTDVLAEADEKFTRYRECVMHTEAFDSYAAWRICALEIDPSLAADLVEPRE